MMVQLFRNRPRLTAGAVAAFCWAVSIFLAAPSLLLIANDDLLKTRLGIFVHQVADPFYRPIDAAWDGGFLGFRILIPTLAHLIGFGAWGGIALIWLAGLCALGLLYWVLRGIVDTRKAVWFTLAFAMTVFSQASHTYLGFPDAVSHLLVMWMIVCPTPLVWFLAIVAGLLNDERMVLSVPLALAFLVYGDRTSLRHMAVIVLRLCIPAATGFAVGMTVRHLIQTGDIGGSPLMGAIYPPLAFGFYPWIFNFLGFLAAFMFMWLLPVQAIVLVIRHERSAYPYWVGTLVYVTAVIFACGSVWDYWRSIACIFPFFLICIRCIEAYRPDVTLRWGPALLVAMVLIPKVHQIGRLISWNRPLLVSVYEYKTNALVMDQLRQKKVRQPGTVRRDLTLRLPEKSTTEPLN